LRRRPKKPGGPFRPARAVKAAARPAPDEGSSRVLRAQSAEVGKPPARKTRPSPKSAYPANTDAHPLRVSAVADQTLQCSTRKRRRTLRRANRRFVPRGRGGTAGPVSGEAPVSRRPERGR